MAEPEEPPQPTKEEKQKVRDFLKQDFKKGFCDECLSELLDIRPETQVKRIIGFHYANGDIKIKVDVCQKCGLERSCNFYQYWTI
jgi:hypothetical protein